AQLENSQRVTRFSNVHGYLDLTGLELTNAVMTAAYPGLKTRSLSNLLPSQIIELEAEKEARRRMQALSREDRVLQELEKIAFGDGPASGRLKALELLGKHVGLFKPKEVPVVERSVEDISNQLQRRLEDLLD
ncbi:MAG: hypothetical protein EBW38_12530, partial [Rhodobacteraceae bacterium]|nr:hypothetical protein [Paracoccaceae bacterium]